MGLSSSAGTGFAEQIALNQAGTVTGEKVKL